MPAWGKKNCVLAVSVAQAGTQKLLVSAPKTGWEFSAKWTLETK